MFAIVRHPWDFSYENSGRKKIKKLEFPMGDRINYSVL